MTGQLVDLIRFGYRFYYDKIDVDFPDYYSSRVFTIEYHILCK